MGTVVDPASDKVTCDGRRLDIPSQRTYLLLNKPRGALSTLSDPQGRVTVKTYLPREAGRIFPVGRLDRDVEGVLLFTDDGGLASHVRVLVEVLGPGGLLPPRILSLPSTEAKVNEAYQKPTMESHSH